MKTREVLALAAFLIMAALILSTLAACGTGNRPSCDAAAATIPEPVTAQLAAYPAKGGGGGGGHGGGGHAAGEGHSGSSAHESTTSRSRSGATIRTDGTGARFRTVPGYGRPVPPPFTGAPLLPGHYYTPYPYWVSGAATHEEQCS